MRRVLAVAATLSVFVVMQPVAASEIARNALTTWLGDAVHTSRTAALATLEYCPDNTCERLASGRPDLSSEFEDFAFLYLAIKSEYVYLKDDRPEAVDAAVKAVVSTYRAKCGQIASPDCLESVLRYLQSKTGASLSFVRFDEGRSCTVPQPLLGVQPTGKSRCLKVASAVDSSIRRSSGPRRGAELNP
jgi:hypothetical protein